MSRGKYQLQRRMGRHTHHDDGDVTYDWRDCVSDLSNPERPFGPAATLRLAKHAQAVAQANWPDEVYRIVRLG